MTAQVAADLRAAAEVLKRDGWGRGRYTNPNTGRHCVAGALGVVSGEAYTNGWREAVDALAIFLGISPWPLPVYRWNDESGRTADEVIAALYAAADAAEAAL